MKTIYNLQLTLGCHYPNQIPKNYIEACENCCKHEHETLKRKPTVEKKWNETYNLLKNAKKTKRVQSRIRFGKVTLHEQKDPAKVVETTSISNKLGREIISGKVWEKHIHHLITVNPKWEKLPCGTHESLMDHLMVLDFSLEQLSKDLKRVWFYFRKMRPAILGYKSSWKINYRYDELKFNPWKGPSGTWEKTGRKKLAAPNLRMYLIKVVKDQEMAAMMIQAYYRRYRAMKQPDVYEHESVVFEPISKAPVSFAKKIEMITTCLILDNIQKQRNRIGC